MMTLNKIFKPEVKVNCDDRLFNFTHWIATERHIDKDTLLVSEKSSDQHSNHVTEENLMRFDTVEA